MQRVVGVGLVVAVVVSTATAAMAAPKPDTPTVGSTISTRDAAVTLRAYRKHVIGAGSATTVPVGTTVAAIDVKVCDKATGALALRRGQFFLETQDRRLIFPAATPIAPKPQLETTRIARGRCRRGWVSFFVPSATPGAFAVFQAGAMFTPTLHTWTLPTRSARRAG